jgi:8-oxo-dGTP diphosphatase
MPKISEIKMDTLWVKDWQPELIGTLVFVLRQHAGSVQVLLIHKRTGHGIGRVNGPGGKLDPGESLAACAIREVEEEVGLQVCEAVCRAELRFVELDGQQWLGYAFTTHQFTGELIETPEALPFWCDVKDVPFGEMWSDDQTWLPGVLQQHIDQYFGKADQAENAPLIGDFLFDNEKLLEHKIYPDKPCSLPLYTPL